MLLKFKPTNPVEVAYKRGYGKGYNTKAGHWPDHKPPLPPEPVIAELMSALQNLRDEYAGIVCTFSEDDPLVVQILPAVDRADEALAAVMRWLRKPEPT